MNVGGELTALLKAIDFDTKQELLNKLRTLRNEVKKYSKEEKKIIMPHLSVAIQQAFYTSEWELIHFKKFLEQRSDYGKTKN